MPSFCMTAIAAAGRLPADGELVLQRARRFLRVGEDVGEYVADAVLALGSMDIVLCEVDR